MKAKDTLIHPEDNNNIHYWTKKWGVTTRQLSDAILYTGSVNSMHVKEYLKKDIWYYAPIVGLFKMLRLKV
jgi:hypothetical protein